MASQYRGDAAGTRGTLAALCRSWGVDTSFVGVDGRRRRASPDSLRAVLRALGVDAGSASRERKALEEARHAEGRAAFPPVVVAWDGRLPDLPVRTSAARLNVTIDPLDAESPNLGRILPVVDDGQGRRVVRLPEPLGPGRFVARLGSSADECLVISAPRRPRRADDGGLWGAFLPLHAQRSHRDWGIGDFTDLAALGKTVASRGGDFVGTLPLLAAFLDEPFEPSPYAPVSRRFWNELFVDPEAAPELAWSTRARQGLGSAAFRNELHALRDGELVDYRRAMALKRSVLEELADAVEKGPPERRDAFRRFAADPDVEAYARFRAFGEKLRTPWQEWPVRPRSGRIPAGDVDPRRQRYHAYVQWIAREQLDRIRQEGTPLYLDLPVGAHPSGYDVWKNRHCFLEDLSTGAPPDDFFTGGQSWGFPPPHPAGLREGGYEHLVTILRHHLRVARVLRIDHVMALHRLFVIPPGAAATDGVYLRYPADELHAIVALEAHRNGALVVGEDLGTVPAEVRRAMRRHGMQRMFVLPFERDPAAAPPESLACLDTHDMVPFPGWVRGLDVTDRAGRGILDREAAARERETRRRRVDGLVRRLHAAGTLRGRPTPARLVRAALRLLARGAARILLVNLEDLWLETRPQNVPGTTTEHPNWRRKSRLTLEEIATDRRVGAILREVDRFRKGGASQFVRFLDRSRSRHPRKPNKL